jgi:uncharacterized protein (DUF305 family)
LRLVTSSSARAVLTATLASALVLGACSADTGTDDSPPSTTAAAQTSHNSMDTQFAQQMIVHHEGAVEMAQLAQENAVTPEVQDLAGQIEAAQGPEVELMQSWLQEWGEPTEAEGDVGGMEGMDHGDMGSAMEMDGMSQEEAMADLGSVSGAEFDRRFLELMIEHHRGAVMMAQAALADGQDPKAQELAEQVVADQEAEIERMEQLLEDL